LFDERYGVLEKRCIFAISRYLDYKRSGILHKLIVEASAIEDLNLIPFSKGLEFKSGI